MLIGIEDLLILPDIGEVKCVICSILFVSHDTDIVKADFLLHVAHTQCPQFRKDTPYRRLQVACSFFRRNQIIGKCHRGFMSFAAVCLIVKFLGVCILIEFYIGIRNIRLIHCILQGILHHRQSAALGEIKFDHLAAVLPVCALYAVPLKRHIGSSVQMSRLICRQHLPELCGVNNGLKIALSRRDRDCCHRICGQRDGCGTGVQRISTDCRSITERYAVSQKICKQTDIDRNILCCCNMITLCIKQAKREI